MSNSTFKSHLPPRGIGVSKTKRGKDGLFVCEVCGKDGLMKVVLPTKAYGTDLQHCEPCFKVLEDELDFGGAK